MIKLTKRHKVIVSISVIAAVCFLPALHAARQNFGEYNNIRKAARIEMAPHATEECTKYCKIEVVNIYQNYALLNLIPDMKHCVTDSIEMVMKKNDEGWKLVELGSSIEIDAMVVNKDGTETPYEGFSERVPKELWKNIK